MKPRILKSKISLLIFLFSLFISIIPTRIVKGSHIASSNRLVLTNSSDDPYKMGVIRVMKDRWNVEASSDTAGRFFTFDSDYNQLSDQQIQDPENYPLQLNTLANGLNIWDPSTQATWVGVVNNTENTSTYNISLVKQKEGIAVGSKEVFEINNSLTVFNLDMDLVAGQPYILFITNVIGDFVGGINWGSTMLMDPEFTNLEYNTLTINPARTVIFVPHVSGRHVLYFSYNIGGGNTIVQMELREFPVTNLTPGSPYITGDDLFEGTFYDAANKSLKLYCFALDVERGNAYTYYLKVNSRNIMSIPGGANARVYVKIPTMFGYTSINTGNGATITINKNGGVAIANGKILVLAVETVWNALYEYVIELDEKSTNSHSVGETRSFVVEPFSLKSIKFSVSQQTLLRVNATEIPSVSNIAIIGLYRVFRSNYLVMKDNINALDISNATTDDFDRFYLVSPGDYYLVLNNLGNNLPGKIEIQLTSYPNNIVDGALTQWQDTYSTSSNSWTGFNDSLNFQSFQFNDSGKLDGAKIPRAFKFTIDNLTFASIRFNLPLDNNPTLESGDWWSGNLEYVLVGPNGYFNNETFLTQYDTGAMNWAFDNNSIPDLRTGETNILTLLTPGDYYLLVTLDKWENQTTGPHNDYLEDPMTLNIRIKNYNNHFYWTDYQVSTHPTYRAYSFASDPANGFRSVNYLNFSAVYNTPSYYTSQLTDFNTRQYDYGIIYNVMNADAFNWTQLLLYYDNCTDLGDEVNTPAMTEANPTGISIIYDGFWNSFGGLSYYNAKIDFQGGYMGQSNVTGPQGTYSMEFGVLDDHFLLWVNPHEYTIGDADLDADVCIEITQYNTPKLTAGVSVPLPSQELDLTALWYSLGIGGPVAAVIVVLAILAKKGKLSKPKKGSGGTTVKKVKKPKPGKPSKVKMPKLSTKKEP
ncbi:MAG: hypothetical protein ACTSXP_13420 [Promethearchaeota archaeon]